MKNKDLKAIIEKELNKNNLMGENHDTHTEMVNIIYQIAQRWGKIRYEQGVDDENTRVLNTFKKNKH